ncbi:MAG: FAD-binding oxidoreductase, partial [Bdellovibrionales bacterium]|nr:FAD-binding oxidoreductase [Oligoflexia bacterium]
MSVPSTLHSGESLSYWIDSASLPSFEPLKQDLTVEVCVVGAGLGGLTTAYLLQKEGKKVCVLEDHEIGSGQSGRTTAHFTTSLDDRYFNLEKYHGKQGSKLAAESHQAALNKVEEIVRTEKIDCDFEKVSGFLFTAPEQSTDLLEKELKAIHRAGLNDVHFVDRAPIPDYDTGIAIEFPNQIQLHPMKYMKGLALKFLREGGQIYTRTHVSEVRGGKDAVVKTKDGFTVRCDSIVVATNTPINDLFAIHTKQAPYRTYVIAARVPKGNIPKGLYWDTLDPYHYVRLQNDEDDPAYELLIVGGEDHKTGQDSNPTENYAR